MMKNILNLSKIKRLSKLEQKSIFGGKKLSRCIASCGGGGFVECDNLLCSATDGIGCTETDIDGETYQNLCPIA